MFFTCCRRPRGQNENYQEPQTKQPLPLPDSPPPRYTATSADHTKKTPLNDSKEDISKLKMHKLRAISSSSSLRSMQSFYSAKSTDDGDFYSVCSESSYKERF